MDTQSLIYRVLPHLVMEIARKYFRLEIEGAENLPRRGAAIIIPNHSGYSGFDALLLSHEIYKITGRVPRVLTHHFWFLSKVTSVPAKKVGFVEASMESGLKHLGKNSMIVLFPEGESGNFKPTAKRYHLQEFKRGFIRLALQKQSPIIPTLILGAEETHINLARLKFGKILSGAMIPLPLNIIPLPAKWKIKFLKPVYLPYKPSAADDRELINEIAQEIREEMQEAISAEVAKRGSPFI